MSQFRHAINNRIAETQTDLASARESGDEYLVGVRLGELESLARVAAEHGVEVSGVAESLARHGLATPTVGIRLMVDRQEAELVRPQPSSRPASSSCS